jgi:hypothetical protein
LIFENDKIAYRLDAGRHGQPDGPAEDVDRRLVAAAEHLAHDERRGGVQHQRAGRHQRGGHRDQPDDVAAQPRDVLHAVHERGRDGLREHQRERDPVLVELLGGRIAAEVGERHVTLEHQAVELQEQVHADQAEPEHGAGRREVPEQRLVERPAERAAVTVAVVEQQREADRRGLERPQPREAGRAGGRAHEQPDEQRLDQRRHHAGDELRLAVRHALQPRVDHADERLAEHHRDREAREHRADERVERAGADRDPGRGERGGRHADAQHERAAEHRAGLRAGALDDGRNQDFGAAHPGERRQYEEERIRILPFAEHVRPEIPGQKAADRDRDADLREPFEPEPDEVRDGLRDVRVAESLQHARRPHALAAAGKAPGGGRWAAAERLGIKMATMRVIKTRDYKWDRGRSSRPVRCAEGPQYDAGRTRQAARQFSMQATERD